ncbi:MAG: hypothetical protein ACTSRP_00645 [Candidatus Helarchaeota archaeon]
MKQLKLFPGKEEEREETELMNKKLQQAIERKIDYEKKVKLEQLRKLIPKQKYFTCPNCKLIMHWKIAWGRRNGCPRCNVKFKREDIIEVNDENLVEK